MGGTLKMQPQQHPSVDQASSDSLDRFVAPAREGAAGFWRIVLTVALTLLFGALLIVGLTFASIAIFGLAATTAALQAVPGSVGTLPMLLGTIALVGIASFLAIRLIHRRRAATLLGAWRRFRLTPALWGAFVTISVLAISALISNAVGLTEITWRAWPYPEATGVDGVLLVLLIAALVPLQSGAEELFFRGYLLQEAARFSRSPLVWAILPSILFGLIHYDPDLARQGGVGPIIIGTFMFGFCAAILTARAADLSLAIGVHTGNNLAALLVFEGPFGLGGPAPLSIAPASGMGGDAELAMLTILGAIEIFVLYALLAPYASRLGRTAPCGAAVKPVQEADA